MDAHQIAYFALKEDEGLRLEPYRCTAGKLTIGYGHNLDDQGITEAQAESILIDDILNVLPEVESLSAYNFLSEKRKAVLINMCFNLGLPRLKTFKKMFKALEDEDYVKASEEMLDSKWAEQVGRRATRLAYEMRTG